MSERSARDVVGELFRRQQAGDDAVEGLLSTVVRGAAVSSSLHPMMAHGAPRSAASMTITYATGVLPPAR